MVLKRQMNTKKQSTKFENDVKMYGTQACKNLSMASEGFENDVKMYGTQAWM